MNFFNRIWLSKVNVIRRAFWIIFKQFVKQTRLFEVSTNFQKSKMDAIGLSREKGLKKLNNVLEDVFKKKYNEKFGMFSEHLILLAAISLNKFKPKRILEIGTYDGKTALILSRLFPSAEIITIDLPSEVPLFELSYNRNNKVDEFIKSRNKYLNKTKNIKFMEVNSLTLCNWNKSFDLIWIDGAHGYPTVAMDIINSLRLANINAYILIDDIFKKVSDSDKMYKSIGGYMSMKTLKEANLISQFYLFHKRLGGIHNMPHLKKYVGLFVKTKPYRYDA